MPSEMRSEALLTLPQGWLHVMSPDDEVVLQATAPHPAASGFTPNVAVLASASAVLDLPSAQHAVRDLLTHVVDRPDIEDVDVHDVAGRDVGYLRIAHRLDRRELITESWCWLVEGTRWVVVATVDCADYADYCDLVEDIVHSFEPPTQPLAG